MTKTSEHFEINDRVKIDGENGYYWVRGFGKDGSLSLWGGSANPNQYRQNRAVLPENAKHDDRKIARKFYPEAIAEDVSTE